MVVEKTILNRTEANVSSGRIINMNSYRKSFTGKALSANANERTKTSLQIFCDFDGTVCSDSYDIILEHLADAEWKKYEELWQTGKITGNECLSKQIPLINGDWSDIVKVLEHVTIDPYFKSFVNNCQNTGTPVYIVSAGLDKVIHYLLDREGIKVNGVWASKFFQLNDGTWSAHSPSVQSKEICQSDLGACKCAVLESARSASQSADIRRVVVGDGRSDFCWVKKADIVFAKSGLATYCGEKNIDFIGFTNFLDVQKSLEVRQAYDSVLDKKSINYLSSNFAIA